MLIHPLLSKNRQEVIDSWMSCSAYVKELLVRKQERRMGSVYEGREKYPSVKMSVVYEIPAAFCWPASLRSQRMKEVP